MILQVALWLIPDVPTVASSCGGLRVSTPRPRFQPRWTTGLEDDPSRQTGHWFFSEENPRFFAMVNLHILFKNCNDF